MGYIIENAYILKEKKITKTSLLIEGNRIAANQSFKYFKHIKMNTEAFIMAPSFVLFDSKIPLNAPYQELRKYFIDHFIMRGCTTFITFVSVSYESQLEKALAAAKTALISCPLDFLLAVKVPLRLITTSFIHKCKKEKIPAIFLDIENVEELNEIPWGWIREALFPYNCKMIPLISTQDKKEAKKALSKWKSIMEKEKVPSIFEEMLENLPLSKPILNKLGLYPQKGSLNHGSEVSYNLYLKTREIMNVDEVDLFNYHSDRLAVTVQKGKVVRAGEQVLFKPGYGEYVKVNIPSYFSL